MQVRYTARDTNDADEWRDAGEQSAQPAAQHRPLQVAPSVELLQLIGAFSNEQLSAALVTAIGNQAVAVELIRLLGLTKTELVDAAAICCSALRDELITYEQARVALDAVNSGVSVRDAFTDADVIYEELFSFDKNFRARQWRSPVIPSPEDKPEPKKARWKYASKTVAPQEPPPPEIDDSLVLDEALQLGESQPSPGPLTLDDFDPESITTVPAPKKKKKSVPAAAAEAASVENEDQEQNASDKPASIELAPMELEPIELAPVELTPVELTPVEAAPVELAVVQSGETALTDELAVETADAAPSEDLAAEVAAADVALLEPVQMAVPAVASAQTVDSAGNVLARVMATWRQQNAAQQQQSEPATPAAARGAKKDLPEPPPAKPEPVEQNFEPKPELAPHAAAQPRTDDEPAQEQAERPSSFFERMKERMQKIRPRVVIVADQVDSESAHRPSPAPKAEAHKADAEPQSETAVEAQTDLQAGPAAASESQEVHGEPEHPESQESQHSDSRLSDSDDSGLPPNTVTRADDEEKEGVDTLTQTGEGFEAFVATGEGFEPFVATGESEVYTEISEEDAMNMTGDGFEAFQATGEQTAVKTPDGKVPRKATTKRPKTRRERKRKK
jgi:hypothetical protein